MEHISFYTNLINSSGVQDILATYREIFLIVSFVLIVLSIFFIFDQELLIADIKRRIGDFFANTSFEKPRKFASMWIAAKQFYRKGDYETFIVKLDELSFKVLKRFGYVGRDVIAIINDYSIKEEAIPHISQVKRIAELSQKIRQDKSFKADKEEVNILYDDFKDTLFKLGILS